MRPRPRLLLLAIAFAACFPLAAQESGQPIRLDKWRAKGAISVQTEGSVVRLSGRGSISTEVEYLDFALRLKFRVLTPDSEGAVLLRDWESYRDPRTGYRLAIGGPSAGRPTTLLTAFGSKTEVVSGAADASMPAADVGNWHQIEVVCQHDRITVRYDGAELATVEGREPQAGTIGIEAVRGAIECDDVWLTPNEIPQGRISLEELREPAVVSGNAPGFTPPRVIRQVPPRYSRDGMANKTQGTVVLEVLVTPDGNIGKVSLLRSLRCDLDLEAVAAARRWQFAPARRGDSPVPVVVAIELTFRLR